MEKKGGQGSRGKGCNESRYLGKCLCYVSEEKRRMKDKGHGGGEVSECHAIIM